MLDIVSTDTHIRTYTRFFFFVFFYLNNHGLIPVLFITTTIWKSLFAFFSNFESNSRSLSTEYLSLCEHANVGVSLRSFLYCRIIIGRVLKWHFHDGKNGKYCQLLFAAKMGAQTQVSHSQSQTHARTHTLRKTHGSTYKRTFLRKYQEFGLLTSNVLIIRFYFHSFGH